MSLIVVTGANRGIGLELARLYASRGDDVAALVRDRSRATSLAELARSAPSVRVLEADVRSEAALAEAASTLGDRPLDLLIVNAGVNNGEAGVASGIQSPIHDEKAWLDVMMTNVAGVYFTVRAFLPALKAAKGARIAIISSRMGSSALAPGGSYVYRASKAAATNLAANLAKELAPIGIAVGAYHPGWVRTDMGGANADVSVEDSANGLSARFAALSLASTGVFEDYRGEPIPF